MANSILALIICSLFIDKKFIVYTRFFLISSLCASVVPKREIIIPAIRTVKLNNANKASFRKIDKKSSAVPNDFPLVAVIACRKFCFVFIVSSTDERLLIPSYNNQSTLHLGDRPVFAFVDERYSAAAICLASVVGSTSELGFSTGASSMRSARRTTLSVEMRIWRTSSLA